MACRCLLTAFVFVAVVSAAPQTERFAASEYNEQLARQFLDLAAATYLGTGDDQESLRQQCFNLTSKDYQYKTVNVKSNKCDGDGNICQMYVARSDVKNNYVIAFRGTKGLGQLFLETINSLGDFSIPLLGNGNARYGHVHKYFLNAYNAITSDIAQSIGQRNQDTTFFVTGHSLGGSLASLMAFNLATTFNVPSSNIVLITFGQPRTFDNSGSMNLRNLVPQSFRVVHNTDPIPHAPPLKSGDPRKDGNPYHFPQEIWYTEKFNSYQECNTADGEDFKCSDGNSDWKVIVDFLKNEHMHYFNHQLETYGTGGCNSAMLRSTLIALLAAVFALLRIF